MVRREGREGGIWMADVRREEREGRGVREEKVGE